MKDVEKRELARLVKRSMDYGYSMYATVKRLSGLGFKQHTIRAYYKAFSEKRVILVAFEPMEYE